MSISGRSTNVWTSLCPIHKSIINSVHRIPLFPTIKRSFKCMSYLSNNQAVISTPLKDDSKEQELQSNPVISIASSNATLLNSPRRKLFPSLGVSIESFVTEDALDSSPNFNTKHPVFAPNLIDVSSNLLVRAGYIRQIAPGLYSYLPFGLRVLNKLNAIIENSLENDLQAEKIDVPILTPGSLWKKSGRWSQNSQELFRFQDRKNNDLLLSPSQEEIVTQLLAAEIKSSNQLPLRYYQVGKKFRDEIKGRGLMRGREFIMNDMYTFDKSESSALNTYETIADLYHEIFARLGLKIVEADADSGRIGGSISHEFHIPHAIGEATVFKCSVCNYAANADKAISELPSTPSSRQLHSNLSDENPITKFINGLIPAGVSLRNDINRKYEVVVEVDPPATSSSPFLPFHIVLLAANRSVNPVAVKTHVGNGEFKVASSAEAVKLIANVIEQQRRKEKNSIIALKLPRLLIDSSIVPQGVDVDWIVSSAAQSAKAQSILNEKSLNTNEISKEEYDTLPKPPPIKEQYMKDLFDNMNLERLQRSDGEVDMDALLKTVDKLVNEKGQEIMNNIEFRGNAAGGAMFGEMLPPIEDINKHQSPPIPTPSKINGVNDNSVNPLSDDEEAEDSSDEENLSEVDYPMQGIFRITEAGDRCLFSCTGTLQQLKGIEIAHIAYVSTQYSQPLGAKYLNKQGKEKSVEMGFYGIGISRLMGAIAEINTDINGLKWPSVIAPYQIAIIDKPTNTTNTNNIISTSIAAAESLYDFLSQSTSPFSGECILDIRANENFANRMKELRFIGVPYIISTDNSSDLAGNVEIEIRRNGKKIMCSKTYLLDKLAELNREEQLELKEVAGINNSAKGRKQSSQLPMMNDHDQSINMEELLKKIGLKGI